MISVDLLLPSESDLRFLKKKMSDSASVTASSLAITENRPRRTGGCVGIFFQLFDWNRRFAKKKLFSKRLLPPDRAKESSKKFGGDEKLPKLRLIADENSGGFPNTNKNRVSTVINNTAGKNGVQTPSLVARLMGLESMPPVHRDNLHKSVSNKDEFENQTTRQDYRPQKLQKTGMADRRTVTRFGAEALQIKNVLSRSRKHHHPKLSSPVKTTTHHSRKNTSRLIDAATRILEPRNKSKYAITYAHSSRTERMKVENLDSNQQSCKNCGNPLHVQNGNSRFDQEQDFSTKFPSSTYFKDNNRRLNCFPSTTDAVNDPKDFVTLNRNLSGKTRSRVPVKVEDTKFDKRGNDKFSQGQKRHFTHVRKQPRMVGSGSSCTGNKMKQEYHQGQNGKNSDGMMFRFGSQMKNNCEVPRKIEKIINQNCKSLQTSCNKLTSNQIDKKICLQESGDYLGDLIKEKVNELTSQIHGTPLKKTPVHIFQELICALNIERSLPENEMEFSHKRSHNKSFCLQTNSEKAGASLIGYKNSNYLSPGSVLEASFSNDSCCSSSLEDSSVRMQNDSMSYTYDESQFQDSESNLFYSSSELVDTISEIMWTKFGNFFGTENSKTRYQSKRFVFDCLIEYLDSKYGQNSKYGFKSWMGSKILIDEVVEEVMRWMDFIGLDADEVAERDMRSCLGKLMDFEVELNEIGGKIEGDLFKMLVDEIIVDLVII